MCIVVELEEARRPLGLQRYSPVSSRISSLSRFFVLLLHPAECHTCRSAGVSAGGMPEKDFDRAAAGGVAKCHFWTV